ncbi:MAG TPA: ADP-ribosylation factor-like protein [Geobacteraceae bacterium]|nr:ADP-ribosylation factor-like protein [Geobacteraceae bacterium]
MPLINHAKGEINAKLIVAGPAFAGKTTNLQYIYGKLKESFRGKFKSMNLQNDRMLFFDFTPSAQGSVHGYTVRFHVYTMGGEVTHPSSWKMVLKGADGLLFVADSGPDRMAANVASLKSVQASLAAYGKSLNDIPCVIQCNKRDVQQAHGLEEMGRLLNPENFPLVPAVAGTGEGVLESLFALVNMVLKGLRAGGLELEGEPEQLQRMTEVVAVERPETLPSTVTDNGDEAVAEPASISLSDAEEEPAVEIAGGPELLEGGGVRLPISISFGGKTKRLTLTISLTPGQD